MKDTKQNRYLGMTKRQYKRMKANMPGNSNPGKNKVITCQATQIEKAMAKYPRSIKTAPNEYFSINLKKDLYLNRNSFFTRNI